MRQDIKFAGLTLLWNRSYAKAYSDKLHEMGFSAKEMQLNDSYIVAYSHRDFSPSDAESMLIYLQSEEGKSE